MLRAAPLFGSLPKPVLIQAAQMKAALVLDFLEQHGMGQEMLQKL